MKLKNKIAAITAAAMLAFAGTGFAAWTFTQQRDVDAAITDKVSVGIELNDDFKLYNADNNAEITNLYLICDAPTGKSYVLSGEGAYWASDAAGAVKVDDVYIKGSLNKDIEDNILDKATVTVSFDANHDLDSNYITFGNFADIADEVVTVANNAEVKSDNFDLPTLSYVDDEIPHSVAALTAMNTALATELADKALSFNAQITA